MFECFDNNKKNWVYSDLANDQIFKKAETIQEKIQDGGYFNYEEKCRQIIYLMWDLNDRTKQKYENLLKQSN